MSKFLDYPGLEHYNDKVQGQISQLGLKVDDRTAYDKDLMQQFVPGYFINTSGAVGTTLDTSAVTQNVGWGYIVAEVKSGQQINMTGSGGTNPRVWCFLDSAKKILSSAAAGASVTDATLTAPADGYLVYNTALTNNDRKCILLSVDTVKERIEADEAWMEGFDSSVTDVSSISDYIDGFWRKDGTFTTSTSGFSTVRGIKVKRGDVVYGTAILLTDIVSFVTEVDADGNYIATLMAGSSATANRSCVIPHDCIINISLTSANRAVANKTNILRYGTTPMLRKYASPSYGSKYAALGDSITVRKQWQEITNYLTGLEDSTFACAGMQFGGFAFHYPDGANSQAADRLLKATDFEDCKVIVVCGYANNMYANNGAGTPMGAMTDPFISISESDAAAASSIDAYRLTITAQSFIPQAKSAIEWIIKAAPSARIIIVGAFQMSSSQRPGWHIQNGNGYTTEDYSNALKEVAGWYGLPYVDLEHEGGANSLNWQQYFVAENDVHPNYVAFDGTSFPHSGMAQMGTMIAKAIK